MQDRGNNTTIGRLDTFSHSRILPHREHPKKVPEDI
jgi:hypothetical protein